MKLTSPPPNLVPIDAGVTATAYLYVFLISPYTLHDPSTPSSIVSANF